jgi:hypothetical protein
MVVEERREIMFGMHMPHKVLLHALMHRNPVFFDDWESTCPDPRRTEGKWPSSNP